jgi:hypothetical protein
MYISADRQGSRYLRLIDYLKKFLEVLQSVFGFFLLAFGAKKILLVFHHRSFASLCVA